MTEQEKEKETQALKVWRKGMAPQLTNDQLGCLRLALAHDDPRIIQGATTSPPPLQSVQGWPVEAADAVTFAFWQGIPGVLVWQAENWFAGACFECDQRHHDPARCRYFLNWYDDFPRHQVFAKLQAEIERELIIRLKIPLNDNTPGGVVRDWLLEHGRDTEAGWFGG